MHWSSNYQQNTITAVGGTGVNITSISTHCDRRNLKKHFIIVRAVLTKKDACKNSY